MKSSYSVVVHFVVLLCFSFNTNLSLGVDTISANESLTMGQNIVSSSGNFELGFFRPGNSPNFYIGIWYTNIEPSTVVWVANRDIPITTSEPRLSIIQGNLVLVDQLQNTIWSTNVGNATTNNSVMALLRDDGNLILTYTSNASTHLPIWQSFDYPTDTLFPGAKLGYDKRTNKSQVLIPWKDSSDPAPGLFSMELDPNRSQVVIKWNRTRQYWETGPWNGTRFSLVPEMRLMNMYNFSYIDNENESYFTYYTNDSTPVSRLFLDVSGQLKQLRWLNINTGWFQFWAQPRQQCGVYAYCGAFGVCDNANSSCNCLSGFEPRSDSEWLSNDYSGGCVRNEELQCNAITKDDDDSLWMNLSMGFPAQDTNITVEDDSQCRSTCFGNCSCTAYSYDGLSTCSILTGNLLNLRQFSVNETGRSYSIKLGNLPQVQTKAKKSTKLVAIVVPITVVMILLMCSFGYIGYRRRISKGKERRKVAQWTQTSRRQKAEREAKELMNENDDKVIDVPYFALETILEATDNFSDANKLGQGGFGPVYKGIFSGGEEIAVKKLSSHSGQGMEEFKNEVTLIAKLQHRILVRLLGYCINATEQILLYEYMPNKSLDKFIFDGTLSILLDWTKRYDIILGIARGLVYLHHDSRLKIIHRDLKTSNILLDVEMNPKISDFGLARIIEGKGTEVNTNKVVGTYGYMSPEYALDGMFSIKSDVFSFGVVVLEIISGRRNTGFYQSKEAINLLSYAWRLWIEESAILLIDKSLLESCNRSEAMKCITVALLCVQEDPNDRPSMSDVVQMLGGEGTSLPRPNQPAFVTRRRATRKPYNIVSDNQMTNTMEEGR